jgi:hypothetical protein
VYPCVFFRVGTEAKFGWCLLCLPKESSSTAKKAGNPFLSWKGDFVLEVFLNQKERVMNWSTDQLIGFFNIPFWGDYSPVSAKKSRSFERF